MTYIQSKCWAVVLIVGCLVTSTTALDDDQTEHVPPERLRDMLELAREIRGSQQHECPHLTMRISPALLEDGQKPGWVLVIFDVSAGGEVISAEIVDASLNEEYRQKALELVSTFRFMPKRANSIGSEFNNWVERVDFLPDGADSDPTWPDPKQYFDVDCYP